MEGVFAALSGRSLREETEIGCLLRSRVDPRNTKLTHGFLSGKCATRSTATYGERDTHARAIGSLLQSIEAAGEPGLVFPAGLDLVAALVGVHSAGAIAVPLSASGWPNSVDGVKSAIADANNGTTELVFEAMATVGLGAHIIENKDQRARASRRDLRGRWRRHSGLPWRHGTREM
jgi:acyl-CoA synthetase (AMP-forming)/AMP-acid ligase II